MATSSGRVSAELLLADDRDWLVMASLVKEVLILDKEHKWFERGVREAIYKYVRWEEPTLNRGGSLRHNLARA